MAAKNDTNAPKSLWLTLEDNDVLNEYVHAYSLTKKTIIHLMKLAICEVLNVSGGVVEFEPDGGIRIAIQRGADVVEKIVYARALQQRRICNRFNRRLEALSAENRAEEIMRRIWQNQSSVAYAVAESIQSQFIHCSLYLGLNPSKRPLSKIENVKALIDIKQNALLPHDRASISKAIGQPQTKNSREALLYHVTGYTIDKNSTIVFRLERKTVHFVAFRLEGHIKRIVSQYGLVRPNISLLSVNWRHSLVTLIYGNNTKKFILNRLADEFYGDLRLHCRFIPEQTFRKRKIQKNTTKEVL